MIDNNEGYITIYCDKCDLPTDEFDDFYEAMASVKANSWKITKEYGEWQHYCPDCKEELYSPKNDFTVWKE